MTGSKQGSVGEVTGLDHAPDHWLRLRNKRFMQEVDRRSTDGSETLLSLTREHGLIPQSEFTERDSSASSLENYRRCLPGEIVMNRMQAWNGMFGVADREGLVSPDYSILRAWKGDNSRFLVFLYRTPMLVAEFRRRSQGVGSGFNRLYWEDFGDVVVPLPPRPEQDAIVAYLDVKLEAIDRYLRVKEREIALLEERKRALIHRAVTRGLDDNPQLQPSGIPWLPEIPVGWESVALRRLLIGIDQGVSPLTVEGEVEGEFWGVLKSGATNNGIFREDESKRLPPSFPIDPLIVVQEGDVVVSRASGSTKHVGSVARVGKVTKKLILSDKNFRLNLKNPALAGFLTTAMMSSYFRRQLELVISGAEGLANNLPSSALKALRLAVPPEAEAMEIERYLSGETSQIDITITRARRQIERMQEYRTALISEAVTGRLNSAIVDS